MNGVLLPMYEPVLGTYNVYAALFSIIAKDTGYLPWYYSKFISIGMNTVDDTLYFTDHFSLFEYGDGYSSCPWLAVSKPAHKKIYNEYSSNLKEVLIRYLRQNQYVWLYLDQYYIPQSDNYRKKHRDHSVLVYGFDEEEGVFYIADNLEHGKFTKAAITYEELEHAWDSEVCEHFRRFFRALSRKDAEYTFDPGIVKKQIGDYLDSQKLQEGIFWDQVPVDGPHAYVQKKDYWIFGQDVYRYVLELLSEAKEEKKIDLDIRLFHLLWEHKRCMKDRLQYMSLWEQERFEAYESVLQESFITRNLALKYNFTKNSEILDKMTRKMIGIVQQEDKILRDVLQAL